MDIILKSLLRSPLVPLIVALQVAIAFAICANTTYVMKEQIVPLMVDDGIQSPDELVIVWDVTPQGKPWPTSRIKEAELRLSNIPGVTSVSAATSLPFKFGASVQAEVARYQSGPRFDSTIYIGDNLIRTLGLVIVDGRDFVQEEASLQLPGVGFGQTGSVIISQKLADALFPGGGALGGTLDIVDAPAPRTIVGIVNNMPSNDLDTQAAGALGNTMIFPGVAGGWRHTVYAMRASTSAGGAAGICARALGEIANSFRAELAVGITPQCSTYSEMKYEAMKGHRAIIWLLSGISMLVLVMAVIGVGGLTSYWVQSRTVHIGIRRALGATRGDVLREVLSESTVLVLLGLGSGLVLNTIFSGWITRHLGIDPTPIAYIAISSLFMFAVCQMAALKAAIWASRVSPMVALRSA
ncbi:FtsX-like permease family protein [Stenotrophomonas maltophilia]|uniref:FtsX-like permease family protein n=1 Tax=Stenotrophomonas maltophilia TaxID=40324 RepID=UPI00066E9523|nr:FtsX-like permease family protein [Stenotrophomonas maltophilia]